MSILGNIGIRRENNLPAMGDQAQMIIPQSISLIVLIITSEGRVELPLEDRVKTDLLIGIIDPRGWIKTLHRRPRLEEIIPKKGHLEIHLNISLELQRNSVTRKRPKDERRGSALAVANLVTLDGTAPQRAP